ncbi:hypothetical protein SAMN02745945_00167 [Peptoclostridium litorale DSM 5388]|uniref:Uncharacterized protein n=1 Tax=Peptoclostridium litorale DSM 5388 TaxID=1121324 RepID=A0A069RKD2_PEPLI|nr:hypothetical protein [Peptoclostridium litorale]KDR96585.1 hypothetical protein CLIT_2c01910 [Peptoclostridium litorale DSM 5388]SIN68813.1 hypothetical protein SAMN02745945_00167 [Peptoclostridium litorale DSM 5388]
MNKETIKKAVCVISAMIQVVTIGAVFVINDLTDKKAGVMHHVYYKRHQYESGIYSTANLNWQVIVAALLGVVFTAIFIHAVKLKKGMFYKSQSALAALVGFSVIVVIKGSFFIDMLAYPYFIMAFEIAMGIQVMTVAAIGIFEKKSK